MPTLSFKCPSCDERIKLKAPASPGKKIRCPHCDELIKPPHAEDTDESNEDVAPRKTSKRRNRVDDNSRPDKSNGANKKAPNTLLMVLGIGGGATTMAVLLCCGGCMMMGSRRPVGPELNRDKPGQQQDAGQVFKRKSAPDLKELFVSVRADAGSNLERMRKLNVQERIREHEWKLVRVVHAQCLFVEKTGEKAYVTEIAKTLDGLKESKNTDFVITGYCRLAEIGDGAHARKYFGMAQKALDAAGPRNPAAAKLNASQVRYALAKNDTEMLAQVEKSADGRIHAMMERAADYGRKAVKNNDKRSMEEARKLIKQAGPSQKVAMLGDLAVAQARLGDKAGAQDSIQQVRAARGETNLEYIEFITRVAILAKDASYLSQAESAAAQLKAQPRETAYELIATTQARLAGITGNLSLIDQAKQNAVHIQINSGGRYEGVMMWIAWAHTEAAVRSGNAKLLEQSSRTVDGLMGTPGFLEYSRANKSNVIRAQIRLAAKTGDSRLRDTALQSLKSAGPQNVGEVAIALAESGLYPEPEELVSPMFVSEARFNVQIGVIEGVMRKNGWWVEMQ